MTATLGPNTLYKVLGPNRMPCHGGTGQWPEPGEWLEIPGPLVMCRNALHLCREAHLVLWLGPELWTVEAGTEIEEHTDKVGTLRARLAFRIDTWTQTTARLFAADCAERVLPIFEAEYPTDTRPREAVAAARAFAHGEIANVALAAAGAAAGDAAGAAAGDAAGDAAWAAARAAARDAAWDAAWDAALAAARDAAWDAEREWQTQRLMAYLRGAVR